MYRVKSKMFSQGWAADTLKPFIPLVLRWSTISVDISQTKAIFHTLIRLFWSNSSCMNTYIHHRESHTSFERFEHFCWWFNYVHMWLSVWLSRHADRWQKIIIYSFVLWEIRNFSSCFAGPNLFSSDKVIKMLVDSLSSWMFIFLYAICQVWNFLDKVTKTLVGFLSSGILFIL